MTDHVYQTVKELESGSPHGDSIANAGLLLERANGDKTGLDEFDQINVTKKQAEALKQALLFALSCHPPVGIRGSIIWALTRTGDENLKKIYRRELLVMQRTMLETSSSMFQVNLALESLGEQVFPDEANSRSALDVELNWKCAERYLSSDKK